jgi:hypothetical protein
LAAKKRQGPVALKAVTIYRHILDNFRQIVTAAADAIVVKSSTRQTAR